MIAFVGERQQDWEGELSSDEETSLTQKSASSKSEMQSARDVDLQTLRHVSETGIRVFEKRKFEVILPFISWGNYSALLGNHGRRSHPPPTRT